MIPPESILVYVGIDAIGDGLMKLPFVRALRAAFPRARVTWLAGKGETVYGRTLAPLVAGLVDEVVEAPVGSRVAELFGPRPLGGRRFDLVVDTQRRGLTTLILRRIRHGTFLSATAGYLFSDRKPAVVAKPPAMVGQLLALAELAAGHPCDSPAPIASDPAAEALAAELLPSGSRYAGFAPGAGSRDKCWPLDRFVAVARSMEAEGMVPVFILGPDEGDLVEPVRAALPAARLPLQSGVAVTPMLTIALARRLAAAVANDSGAGHLLAAADTPLVSLFGPTPAAKFAPMTQRLTVLTAQYWGGEDMAAIPADAVCLALREMMDISPALL